MELPRRIAIWAGAAAAVLAAAPALAQQKIDFILNWVPGGDHAPYYYAKKMGWYKDAGIDLNLEPGKGSAVAVQKVAAGANPIGLADMLVAVGRPVARRNSASTSRPEKPSSPPHGSSA